MNTPAPVSTPQPAPAKPRRRWKKILGIAGIALLGLILLVILVGPPVIGAVAQAKVPEILGEMLQSDVSVGDVSFSWSGRIGIEDFKIKPRGAGYTAALVEVKRVDIKVALGSALGGQYVAEVEITAPKVTVEKGAHGKFNYEFPPAPKKDEPPSSGPAGASEAKPFVQAVIKIRDGAVTIRGDGRETVYTNLVVDAKLDTLAKPVAYALSLEGPAQDKISISGSYDIDRRSGPAVVKLERVSLKNLAGVARAYSPVRELEGVVNGLLEVELQGVPQFTGKGSIEVADARVDLADRKEPIRLERFSFTHRGGLDEKGNGRHVMEVAAGKALSLLLTADITDAFGARAVKAELRVESSLPEVEALLAKAGFLPKPLKLEGALTLSGTVESQGPTDAELKEGRGRPAVRWDLKTQGTGIGLTLDGKPMKIDAVSHTHKGSIDAGGKGGGTIEISSGKAVGATIVTELADLYGVPSVKARIDASSDLGELAKTLEKLIGLKPDMELRGGMTLKGEVAAKGSESARVDFSSAGTDLAAVDRKTGKVYELEKSVTKRLVGSWDGKARAAVLETLKLESSFASIDAKGGVALKEAPAFEVRESSLRLEADLAKLGGKLGIFMEKPPVLGGKAVIVAKASGEKIDVDGTLSALRFDTYGPVDAVLKHAGTLDPKGNGTHTISLDAGKAVALRLKADLKEAFDPRRSVKAELKVDSDLGALGAMLPGLVQLKPGTDLLGMAAVSGRVELAGADRASFDMTAVLTDLAAFDRATKKREEVEKSARATVKGAWDGAKKAVDLEAFTLESSLAAAGAKGGFALGEAFTVKESSFSMKAPDLAKIGAKLGLFMADPPGLSGAVEVGGTYAGDRFDVSGHARGVRVMLKKDGKPVTYGPVDATLSQKGTFEAKPGGALRIETCTLTSAAADLTVSGAIKSVADEKREGELSVTGVVRPVALSTWVPDLGLGGPEIQLAATLSLKPGILKAAGRTQLDGLTLTSKDEAGKPVLKTAKAKPVEFTATMEGEKVSATLSAAVFEWIEAAYRAKGKLETVLRFDPKKGTDGETKVVDLEIEDDKKNKVKEPLVTLKHDVGMRVVEAGKPAEYDVRTADLSSGFVNGRVTGKAFVGEKDLAFENLVLDLKYHPDRTMAVLKPWLPGKLEGTQDKSLKVTLAGRTTSREAMAILRQAAATVDLDLAKYSQEGFTVSGKTQVRLEKGVMKSGTPLQVNSGTTSLDLALDFREPKEQPASRIVFGAKDVDANSQLGWMLARVNPLFHTAGLDGAVAGKMSGDFTLDWKGQVRADEPDWVRASEDRLSGRGVLAVRDMKISGSPTVKAIFELMGEGNLLQGEMVGTDIRIGREPTLKNKAVCQYTNMTIRMARYELKFTGWVGFDQKMDLLVEMPMTENLQRKYPQLARYTQKTIFLKLTGTVDSPSLDIAGMLAEAVKRALPGLIEDKAKNLLDNLLKDKKKKEK